MILGDAGLGSAIMADLRRQWPVLILGVFVLGSALAVVWTAYDARAMTNALNQQLQHRDELDIEWRHLLLEEQTLTEHSRVGRMAEKQLGMGRPAPGQEVVVRLP